MPRYFGEGLKYFQIDVDFHDNDKIDILRDHYDDAAVSFWIFLHGRIFDNGYYLEISERFVNKFCKKILRKTPEQFYEMLDLSLTIKVFDRQLYNNYQILTSRGIQTRYLFMGKRWERIKLIEEYMLESVNYEDSTITLYNIQGQHIGYKKKQGELIREEFPSRSHLKKTIASNNKAVETKQPNDVENTTDQAEQEITEHHFRDMQLEEMAASFFNYNEQSGYDKVKTFTYFLTSLNNRGELEEFRTQFPAYIKYKKITGYEHKFSTFIGKQSEQFKNGAWKEENWVVKFDKELSKPIGKNGSHKAVESKAEQALASHDNYIAKRTRV